MRGLISVAVLAVAAFGAVSVAEAQAPVATHASYTVEPFAPASPIMLTGKGVRLRAEPFATKETPVLSSGSSGLQLNVVGIARMSGWNWYQVVLGNGQKAFVRSDLTSAPSQGGAAASPAPQPTVQPIVHPTPQTPIPQTPLVNSAPSATPAPTPLPAPTSITQYPTAASSVPATPSYPQPAYPQPAPAASTSLPSPNTVISLTPRSPAPTPLADEPRTGDASGLQSLPPANN